MLSNARLIACVVLVLLGPTKLRAQDVAFAIGDASFPGLLYEKCDFLSGGTMVEAAAWFCRPVFPDSPIGTKLDLSKLPRAQLDAARMLARRLLAEGKTNNGVFLFVCDAKFDFTRTWLGVPYNRKLYRIGRFEGVNNCFGPTGASQVSQRESPFVPALQVKAQKEGQHLVTGDACLCLVDFENAGFQCVRYVIATDGSLSEVKFRYDPQYRICFDEGDACFVANAERLLATTADRVEFESCVFPRHQDYSFYNSPEGLSLESLEKNDLITKELPIEPKGSRMVVTGLSTDVAKRLSAEPRNPNKPWYVFVVDVHYDPFKHKLGRRYNQLPLKQLGMALGFEYVDYNFCYETYPVGAEKDPWPSPLRVAWDGDTAVVKMEDVKLVLIPYWEGIRFSAERNEMDAYQCHITKGKIQRWVRGKMVSESDL